MSKEINAAGILNRTGAIKNHSLSAKEITQTIQSTPAESATKAKVFSGVNSQSNLHVFFDQVKNTPFYPQAIRDLFANIENDDATSDLAKMLQQYEADILSETSGQGIKDCFVSADKYNGALFKQIQQYYSTLYNNQDKKAVIDFVKSYDSFLALPFINQSIYQNLKNILSLLHPDFKAQLETAMLRYYLGESDKKIALNLKIIQAEILPFLGNYVSLTSDMGAVRNQISVLLSNLVRLQNGLPDVLKKRTKKMLSLSNFKGQTGFFTEKEMIKQILLQKKSPHITAGQQLLKNLILNAKDHPNYKEQTDNVIKAMLLAQSSYFPMINTLMVAAKEKKIDIFQLYYQQEDQCTTMMIIGSLEKLGNIECVISFKGSVVWVQIYGSVMLVQNAKKITGKIQQLIYNSGMKCGEIQISLLNKNETIAQLFAKVKRRKAGIYGEI